MSPITDHLCKARELVKILSDLPGKDVTRACLGSAVIYLGDAIEELQSRLEPIAQPLCLADGRRVPMRAVDALAMLDARWPGATLPKARGAIVAAVMESLGMDTSKPTED